MMEIETEELIMMRELVGRMGEKIDNILI